MNLDPFRENIDVGALIVALMVVVTMILLLIGEEMVGAGAPVGERLVQGAIGTGIAIVVLASAAAVFIALSAIVGALYSEGWGRLTEWFR